MTLPLNEDAETCLLASFMHDFQAVGCLLAERNITDEQFHHPSNRIIATVMLEAWRKGEKLDPTLLTTVLQQKGLYQQAGGYEVFTRVTSIPTAAMAVQYADIVQETDKLRRLAILCSSKAQEAVLLGAEPQSILSDLSGEISVISGGEKTVLKTMKQLIFEKLDRVQGNEDDKDIILTGIDKLDRNSPLKQGDMPILSGERKAGKSILSINIAVNNALRGEPVLYFSLEDKIPKVIDRIFAKVTKLPMDRHRVGSMTDWELRNLGPQSKILTELPLTIRDDIQDLQGIVGVIRQHKLRNPAMRLVFVDYAQLVTSPFIKGRGKEEEVANVSRTLRLLAMKLDVAIVLLCQVNKDGQARWSMGLEHDCTCKWHISHLEEPDNGKRMIGIPFQRNGDSDIAFPVAFLGSTCRIETLHE